MLLEWCQSFAKNIIGFSFLNRFSFFPDGRIYLLFMFLTRRDLSRLLEFRFARNCLLELKHALELGASFYFLMLAFSKMNIALAFLSVTDYLQIIGVYLC